MPSIETKIDKDKRVIEVVLAGDLTDLGKVESAVDEVAATIEGNPGFSLIIDLTELTMPGIQALSLMNRLMDDRVKNAQKLLEKVAIVDAGKITGYLPMFFIKPPENLFFEDLESARLFINS